jgi:GxxExxY protein
MGEPLYKKESYKVIRLCMNVYNTLGKGFAEVVYKDALEREFTFNDIPFVREREYRIECRA